MSAPLLELDNVALSLGGKEILRSVSLRVEPGERLVVLGQSGGGKSTILRVILGMLRPSRGRVRFRGRDITRLWRWRLNKIRQRIGMVYQYSALISSLSVRDNLALPLEELTHKRRGEIDQVVQHKLEMVGLPDAAEKLPAQLSGGMRKRVALARALMLDPELILYDEPSAGLDPMISTVIDDLMISTSEKTGAASIIVTHELDSAFKVATRMAMLADGEIIADGPPEDFRNHPDERVRKFIAAEPDSPAVTPMESSL
jgi:phospholipid/cholesterol/gamma-HCH transport system ATP-binding protein